MNQGNAKLSVRHLWKVFGRHPKRVLESDWRAKNRAEVQKATGHVVALRDLTFDVGHGEIFVIMGLSGSGKSTLVRCLLRLIEPSEGQILVDGEDILRYNARQLVHFRRQKASMVFQKYALLPHRRVLENIAWGLEIQGLDRRTRMHRAGELLELVGLTGWGNSYPHELSGGMQQRVGLARALAADPEILLMDEPFSGLDPLIRRGIQDELLSIQRLVKKTIVFITHDLHEALKMGNRIAIMREGQIIQQGTGEEILMSPTDAYVGEFTRDIRRTTVLAARSIMLPPPLCLNQRQKVGAAVHAMDQAAEKLAFVVDGDGHLQGMITLQSAREAARIDASLADCLEQAPLVIQADASLDALLSQVSDYDWSVDLLPVVDAAGKLVGQIHRTVVRDLATQPPIQASLQTA